MKTRPVAAPRLQVPLGDVTFSSDLVECSIFLRMENPYFDELLYGGFFCRCSVMLEDLIRNNSSSSFPVIFLLIQCCIPLLCNGLSQFYWTLDQLDPLLGPPWPGKACGIVPTSLVLTILVIFRIINIKKTCFSFFFFYGTIWPRI